MIMTLGRGTLHIAKPFLERGDKAGWLAHCKTKAKKESNK